MSSLFRVHSLVGLTNSLLIVFHTPKNAYQFRVVTVDGQIFGTQELYYTEEGARKAARICLLEQHLLES